MNLASAPAIAMAGITLYVGAHWLLIGSRPSQRRQNVAFALTCFAMGLYDLFCAGLYSAPSAAQGMHWQRAQIVSLALVGATFPWFVAEYTRLISRKFLRVVSAYFVVSAVATTVIYDDLVLAESQLAVKVVPLPFGHYVQYNEVMPGALTNSQGVVGLLVFAYLIGIALRYYLRTDRQRGKPLLLALVLFFVGVLNDTAVSSGTYTFLYTIEFAYMGMVLLMAFTMSCEMAEAIETRQSLHDSEERFRSLFTNAPAGIGLLQPDGRFIAANSSMCSMFGCTLDDLKGTSIFEHLHTQDAPVTHESVDALLHGKLKSFRAERRYMRDGEAFWGDMSVALIRAPSGTVEAITWIIIGITERRRAVSALRLLNEQLEQKVVERTHELKEMNQKLADSLDKLREDEEAGKLIQFNLLPAERTELGGFMFCRYLEPSLYMSGDFVDYFEIDRNHVGFYIADVSGHGVSSAFITVLLKSFMSNCLENRSTEQDPTILNPAKLIARLNAELLRQDIGKHTTMFYGVLHHHEDRLAFANAGQFPLPLLSHGGETETLQSKGAPLGLFPFSEYANVERNLPGTFSLTFFSDGILEVLSQPNLREKTSYLASLVATEETEIADLVRQVGLDRIESYPDDVTVLMVRRRGATT